MGDESMGVFARLEFSSVASFIAESLWAYPLCLSLHAIGLAVVVGIFAMRDLTILGAFPGLRATTFFPLIKLAWIGFAVNAISGILLFTAQATTFVASIPFLIKISVIFLAAILAAVIQQKLLARAPDDEYYVADGATRLLALLSLTSWIIAIVAGRMIAYF